MKKTLQFLPFLLCAVLLASCAPAGTTPHEYSFFSGFVHGLVLPFAIIGKLFGRADLGLYAATNSGFLYWLGYLFGYLLINGGLLGGGRRVVYYRRY